jgi:hypothetical protein
MASSCLLTTDGLPTMNGMVRVILTFIDLINNKLRLLLNSEWEQIGLTPSA